MSVLGSRGVRSHSVPARPVPRRPEPVPVPVAAPKAPPARRGREWIGPLGGVAAGWLVAAALSGGFGLEGTSARLLHQMLLGGAIFVFAMLLRRRRAARAQEVERTVALPEPPPPVATGDHLGSPDRSSAERSIGSPALGDGSSFDEGLRDIHRKDPKFDPTRFTGYIEMVFSATHHARASRDVDSLRDRVTPELYGELRAQAERLRSLGHARHVEQIEIRAEVTEAWHEDGRDYVTAYIAGSMLDYTVDEATDARVDGSKTVLENVEAFWTFTRPAGLNPWMLSAIQ